LEKKQTGFEFLNFDENRVLHLKKKMRGLIVLVIMHKNKS